MYGIIGRRAILALLLTVGIGQANESKQNFWQELFSTRKTENKAEPTNKAGSAKIVPDNRQEISFSFAPIVKRVKPAVVSINAVQVIERPQHPFFDDDFFRFFFGGMQRQQVDRSLGSGVIVDPKGIIITCYHVVRNAKLIQVNLEDGRLFKAEVIFSDPKNDLSAIRILDNEKGLPLPHIPLSNPGETEVGDLVLAIGNPFGVGQTVTNGIVSATARRFGPHILMQTDAPINPGNSGGALVNMQGELVGVPNAILSKTGASHGIGFAIPVATIRPLLLSAISGKPTPVAWDGIVSKTMTAAEAESFGLDAPKGVLVVDLHPASPALAAGLKSSDIITAINDETIESLEDFTLKLRSLSPDDEVILKVQRRGKPLDVTFKMIKPPAEPAADETVLQGNHPLSGLKVANLSPALALKYDFDPMRTGVVIVEVVNAYGVFFNFNAGDVIEAVNGNEIKSVAELTALIKKEGVRRIRLNQEGHVVDLQIR